MVLRNVNKSMGAEDYLESYKGVNENKKLGIINVKLSIECCVQVVE